MPPHGRNQWLKARHIPNRPPREGGDPSNSQTRLLPAPHPLRASRRPSPQPLSPQNGERELLSFPLPVLHGEGGQGEGQPQRKKRGEAATRRRTEGATRRSGHYGPTRDLGAPNGSVVGALARHNDRGPVMPGKPPSGRIGPTYSPPPFALIAARTRSIIRRLNRTSRCQPAFCGSIFASLLRLGLQRRDVTVETSKVSQPQPMPGSLRQRRYDGATGLKQANSVVRLFHPHHQLPEFPVRRCKVPLATRHCPGRPWRDVRRCRDPPGSS